MARDDDLIEAAEQQFKTINAAKMRAQAHLAEYRAEGNRDGIAEQLQEIANIDTAAANLSNLYSRYHREQNPPAAQPQSDQEFLAKSPERMDYNDTLRIMSKSKYNESYKDQVENMRRGIEELNRRKRTGDIQT